jgi:Predicted exporter
LSVRRFLAIAVWLALILGCSAVAIVATPILTQMSQFIPRSDATADLLDDLYSSVAARMVFVGIDGGSEAARAAVSNRLAAALRATGLFERVLNGPSSLSPDDLQDLFAQRYLLSPSVNAGRFTTEALHHALRQRLNELASPLAPISKEYLASDPTGEFRSVLSLLQGATHQPRTYAGVWVSPDGARALMIVETPMSGFDPKAQAPVVAAIQAAFEVARGSEDVTLSLSGPGVLAVLSATTISTEATLLSLASIGAIIVLLSLAYRSLRVVLLTPLPLLSSLLAATAVIGIVYGGIQGIVLGFGATLMGVSVDYPVHLFSHLRRDQTVAEAMRRVWPTLRLCVLSTAVGYLAMISTSLSGLAQLGIFSIAGLLTAAMVTRWLLPAVLPECWAPPQRIGSNPLLQRLWLLRLPFLPMLALGALLLVVLIVDLTVNPPGWQGDLATLSPIPSDVLKRDAQLRADLGAPEAGHVLFIRAITPEAVLVRSEEVSERLRQLVADGDLQGFDAPSLYLPSQAAQRARRDALPAEQILRDRLAEASAGLPFRPGLFEPFVQAVQHARTARLLGIDDVRHTPLGLRLESLLYPRNDGWTGLVLLSGVRDPHGLATRIAELAYPDVHYVNVRAATARLMTEFRDEAYDRMLWGGVLLIAVLAVGLRSWQRCLVVVLPLLLAIAVTLVLLRLLGEPLTLFHLVSLLLVVGLGIDYGLFFSAVHNDPDEQRRTLHALLVCSSSTMVGFGVLCLSSLPVLNAIGQTVALGVAAAFVFAAIIARPWALGQLPGKGGSR